MHINDRGWVSVAELVVYVPLITIAGIVCSRHSFKRSSGFIYTFILCLFRIVGAICQLLTYHDNSSGLIKATIIIDSIGISPLLLATLGLLSRLIDWVNESKRGFLSTMHFRAIQVVISVGLILSIAGGSSANTNPDGSIKIATTSKVGIILYIIAFVAQILVCTLSIPSWTFVPHTERRIGLAVLLAFPFIAVRLLYSVLAVFVHDHNFSIYNGSVAVYVAMAVVEMVIVVFIYLILGFFLPEGPGGGEIESRPWKKGRDQERA